MTSLTIGATSRRRNHLATGLRWAGRVLAVLMMLFWGAFLVEHVSEWYLTPGQDWPPVWVNVAVGWHLVMVAGLGVMVWKPRPGAVVALGATIGFFATIGYRGFPLIALPNLLPILLFEAGRALGNRNESGMGR